MSTKKTIDADAVEGMDANGDGHISKEEIENWESYSYYHKMEIMRRLGYGVRMGREERLRRYDRG